MILNIEGNIFDSQELVRISPVGQPVVDSIFIIQPKENTKKVTASVELTLHFRNGDNVKVGYILTWSNVPLDEENIMGERENILGDAVEKCKHTHYRIYQTLIGGTNGYIGFPSLKNTDGDGTYQTM